MNKTRKNQLNRMSKLISDISHQLECIRNEEHEAYENLPDSLQHSANGLKMLYAVHDIDRSIGFLQNGIRVINTITQ